MGGIYSRPRTARDTVRYRYMSSEVFRMTVKAKSTDHRIRMPLPWWTTAQTMGSAHPSQRLDVGEHSIRDDRKTTGRGLWGTHIDYCTTGSSSRRARCVYSLRTSERTANWIAIALFRSKAKRRTTPSSMAQNSVVASGVLDVHSSRRKGFSTYPGYNIAN